MESEVDLYGDDGGGMVAEEWGEKYSRSGVDMAYNDFF